MLYCFLCMWKKTPRKNEGYQESSSKNLARHASHLHIMHYDQWRHDRYSALLHVLTWHVRTYVRTQQRWRCMLCQWHAFSARSKHGGQHAHRDGQWLQHDCVIMYVYIMCCTCMAYWASFMHALHAQTGTVRPGHSGWSTRHDVTSPRRPPRQYMDNGWKSANFEYLINLFLL